MPQPSAAVTMLGRRTRLPSPPARQGAMVPRFCAGSSGENSTHSLKNGSMPKNRLIPGKVPSP